MWKNRVQPDRPHMKYDDAQNMQFVCQITKAWLLMYTDYV